MSVASFEEFHKSFLEKLQSPHFGGPPYSEPNKPSAATKELKKRGGYAIFTQEFLSSIYQILREHAQLRDEQLQVHKVATEVNPKLSELRNAMEAVQAVKKRVERSERRTQGLLRPEVWGRVKEALLDCESEIRKSQESFNSMVNPVIRRPTLGQVRWEPVLKLDKYPLLTLKVKAPDQWVYERLNQILERAMQPLRISKITRYRLMSALLNSVGVDIKAITFKQHRRRSDGTKKSVTNS